MRKSRCLGRITINSLGCIQNRGRKKGLNFFLPRFSFSDGIKAQDRLLMVESRKLMVLGGSVYMTSCLKIRTIPASREIRCT